MTHDGGPFGLKDCRNGQKGDDKGQARGFKRRPNGELENRYHRKTAAKTQQNKRRGERKVGHSGKRVDQPGERKFLRGCFWRSEKKNECFKQNSANSASLFKRTARTRIGPVKENWAPPLCGEKKTGLVNWARATPKSLTLAYRGPGI